MKFNCGQTWLEKQEAKKRWHLKFAWRPIRVASGDCRWLEFVWRKGKYLRLPPLVPMAPHGQWFWDYAPNDDGWPPRPEKIMT